MLLFPSSPLTTSLTVPCTGQNGTNIGITDDIGAKLSDAEIKKLEFGSKCLLAGWTFYVTLIWSLKASVLCFYNRITYVSQDHLKTTKLTVHRLGLAQQNVVKWTGVASALAYVCLLYTSDAADDSTEV